MPVCIHRRTAAIGSPGPVLAPALRPRGSVRRGRALRRHFRVQAVNVQSRSKRWLAAATLAKELTAGTLVLEENKREAGNPTNLQGHETFISAALYELRLTAEADPILAGTPLHEVLGDVVDALNGLKLGADFQPSLQALDSALGKAISSLQDWTGDDDSRIEEIISELERAFLISLVITLTSHSHLSDRVEQWNQHHQRFLQNHEAKDLPHYLDIKTQIICPGPAPGRVHMQHLCSALHGDAKVFVAGAPASTLEHYPELQSIVYAQWFTYMHAIWDEQFRGRIARFFDDPAERVRRRDV
jgi:hypothetical protein